MWRAHDRQSVAVAYHWLDAAAQNILIWNGARTPLPKDVNPGDTVRLESWIIAPVRAGDYILQWDMLQENVAWFSIFGASNAQVRVQILPSPTVVELPNSFPHVRLPLLQQPGRWDLWRAAIHLWQQRPLLGIGPDNFRRLYGSFLGLKTSDQRIYANDLYLEVLANTGLTGFLAFMFVLLAVGCSFLRAWKSTRLPQDRMILAAAGLALGAYCAHGLVDYFFEFTSTYAQFWILAGIILGLRAEVETR
jgi:hypothetical protein